MRTERIQVYTDPSVKRLIEVAAIKHGVPVTQFCLDAIKQQLAEEDLLGKETVEIQIQPKKSDDFIASLRASHQDILARRKGMLIDVDKEIENTRDERDREISTSLH